MEGRRSADVRPDADGGHSATRPRTRDAARRGHHPYGKSGPHASRARRDFRGCSQRGQKIGHLGFPEVLQKPVRGGDGAADGGGGPTFAAGNGGRAQLAAGGSASAVCADGCSSCSAQLPQAAPLTDADVDEVLQGSQLDVELELANDDLDSVGAVWPGLADGGGASVITLPGTKPSCGELTISSITGLRSATSTLLMIL